jgi:hypothetical protein
MGVSPRTASLIARLPDHPLAPAMRTAMIDGLAAAEQFADHKSTLARDGRMTPLGQRQALNARSREILARHWPAQNNLW